MVGALLGGWMSDKIGRRVMFLATMIMFIVFALAQAFAPSVGMAGDDPSGARHSARQRHLHRLHLHHGIDAEGRARGDGQPLAIHVRRRPGADAGGDRCSCSSACRTSWIWRVTLGLGARARADHSGAAPRSAGNRGVADPPGPFPGGQADRRSEMYDDSLDMLPDEDVVVPKPRPTAFLADTAQGPDPLARHALRLDCLFLPRAASSRPSLSICRCCS